jgi:hypothetical protein
MKRAAVDSDLPLLEFYLDEIVRKMEARTTRAHRRVSRAVVLHAFMQTRDYRATAGATGASLAPVRQIVAKAIFTARRLAGLEPVPLPGQQQDH